MVRAGLFPWARESRNGSLWAAGMFGQRAGAEARGGEGVPASASAIESGEESGPGIGSGKEKGLPAVSCKTQWPLAGMPKLFRAKGDSVLYGRELSLRVNIKERR